MLFFLFSVLKVAVRKYNNDASVHPSVSLGGFYPEVDFSTPDGTPIRAPPLHLPLDPRSQRAFVARPHPLLPSQADGHPLRPAPVPGAPYQEEEEEEVEEEEWRQGPPFPPFTERGRGGGGGGGIPQRVYESEFVSTCFMCCILFYLMLL